MLFPPLLWRGVRGEVMKNYINIHTHHLSYDNGVFLFNNRFGSDEEVYTKTYFSVGIHPWDADKHIPLTELENTISHKHCLAIGECGLDKIKGPDLEIQNEVFLLQLQLAVNYQKPVIIHCVKAFDELIEISKPYHSKIPLIIHGFNKSFQLAEQLISKGFYLSLNPSIFKNINTDFKEISIDKIFLETDNNQQLSIVEVYKMASYYLKINEDELKEKIYSNFTLLFNTHGR